ncbi:hypothetical protein QNI16_12520 [Cytophagaceae bacterium YF14B1]|uniref:Uncharacterized protein n=1 Tax=Xanthocytophaga flava TaxID=3048013 RepID=A0AAE3QRD7_9BACT|nr:hypothetical protein [Xanthocytophaga flavus]MDJ1481313.1 hypothetical protein [Xanthocytophaga flavus]
MNEVLNDALQLAINNLIFHDLLTEVGRDSNNIFYDTGAGETIVHCLHTGYNHILPF